MEYKHGVRQMPLLHELSPLEAAIEQYSQKAKAYYRNLDVIADTSDPEVDVQTELEHYRQQGKSLLGASEARWPLDMQSWLKTSTILPNSWSGF